MAKLFADENFPVPVVQRLRQLMHDVATLNDIGQAGAGWSDEQVLRYAASEGRAVLTMDRRDFRSLHRQKVRHTGIVICTYNPDWDRFASQVDQALQATPDLVDALIHVYQPQV